MELTEQHPSAQQASTSVRERFPIRILWIVCILAILATALPLTVQLLSEGKDQLEATTPLTPERMATFYLFTRALIGFSCLTVAGTFLLLALRRDTYTQLSWAFLALGLFNLFRGMQNLVTAASPWMKLEWLNDILQYFSALTGIALIISIPPILSLLIRVFSSAQASERRKMLLQDAIAELTRANDALKQEIAERERIEQKERGNLRRVRGIIDNLPLGAIAFDENDTVLHANDLFCQLFGIGSLASNIIGHRRNEFSDIVRQHVSHHEEYTRQLESVLSAKQPHLGTEIAFKDGRTVAQDYIPLFASGIYSGQLFLYRDITREKRVDATKSEFMSLASHQLRTPLTTMRWSLGRLEKSIKDTLGETDERLLDEARKAASRMSHTIDTMLAISRIESGKVTLEVSEFKVGSMINELRAQWRPGYEEKQQTVVIDCPPNLLVQTDPYVFKEILQNLFSNAIKYTPQNGTIHVRVSLLQQHVQVDVSDTGYGIPLQQQEKIFSKFFRGDNVVQLDTEGTGLGLYLVFLLVKLLGATIYFTSQEGKGTTFTLLLPLLAQAPLRNLAAER